MKPINRKTIPYGISNAVLAFALDLAGAPPAKPACVNRYNPDILFAIGGGEKDASGRVTVPSRFAGDSPEEAAKKAFDEGSPGSVTYRFEMTNKLSPLCKAFSDQEKTVKKGERVNTTELAKSIAEKMVSGEMPQDEALVRLSCVILKTYIDFKNQWKQVVPIVQVNNPGRVVEEPLPGGGRVVKGPGYKTWPINASEDTRKRLRI